MKKKFNVVISLGSNFPEGNKFVEKAFEILSKKFYIKNCTDIKITEPFGFEEQNKFYNMLIEIETNFYPFKLLEYLQNIEKKISKKFIKNQFWGERIIDLDIIYFDNIEIYSNKLIIPHEGVYNRNYLKDLLDELKNRGKK